MFLTDSPEDDIVKLRSALSDIKFIAQQALAENKGMTEKVRSIVDDIIKISDVGMYKAREGSIQRAKRVFNEKHDKS